MAKSAAPKFRWGFVVIGVIAVGLVFWVVLGPKNKAKANRVPTVAVTTTDTAFADVPISVSALGSVLAWQSNLIRTQVNGRLIRLNVQEGANVKQGQLLAQIDPAPYQAVLDQTEGALTRDEALLADAKLDLARYQTLAAADSIAKQQVDTQAALVKQDEGLVQIDKANVETARINLSWCSIVSPVTGRAGVRQVEPGNLVATTDTTGIIIINQLNPIAVSFTVPEGDFQRLQAASAGFTKPLDTQAFSQETNERLDTGKLYVVDNRVDPSSGTVVLKARFENQSLKLWPGQFVNVRLTLQTLKHALIVPTTAVNQGPNGPFAYVVGADHKVTVHPVTIAATQDAVTAIANGLNPGDTVVSDGQLSLAPGMAVQARSAGQGRQGQGKQKPA